jgi:hypothetical protein
MWGSQRTFGSRPQWLLLSSAQCPLTIFCFVVLHFIAPWLSDLLPVKGLTPYLSKALQEWPQFYNSSPPPQSLGNSRHLGNKFSWNWMCRAGEKRGKSEMESSASLLLSSPSCLPPTSLDLPSIADLVQVFRSSWRCDASDGDVTAVAAQCELSLC